MYRRQGNGKAPRASVSAKVAMESPIGTIRHIAAQRANRRIIANESRRDRSIMFTPTLALDRLQVELVRNTRVKNNADIRMRAEVLRQSGHCGKMPIVTR